jgi:hypothetical protein
MLQGQPPETVPFGHFFGLDDPWLPGEQLLQSVGSIDAVRDWAREVRQRSHDFIASLSEEDFHRVPDTSSEGNSIAKVLMQTIGHTGVHIGYIQLLRTMIKAGVFRQT